MKKLQVKVDQTARYGLRLDVFRNEDGSIDLSSIMIGIIAIGLIGNVTATVLQSFLWRKITQQSNS